MVINETYEPEASTTFFDELEVAIGQRPNYRRVYHSLYLVFKNCLNQNTSESRIIFSGDFAKTDYLLKDELCKCLHKMSYVKSYIMPSFATNDNNCYCESKRCA